MTAKQKAFADQYVIDFNGAQAAIRAGYSSKTARTIAAEILTKPDIQQYITTKQEELSEKTGITARWVLERFRSISDRCMTVVPVMYYDRVSRSMVQATTEHPETGKEIGLFEFDSAGANRATEMLGKHIGFFEKDNKQTQAIVNLKVGYGAIEDEADD